MASGVELGTAYLSLVASTSGLAPSVRKGLGGAEKEASASGKRAGKKFSGGIGGAIKGGASRLVAPLGAALAGVGVAKFFSDSVASASDFQEAGTKIEAIFGKGGGAVQKFAKNAATDIGQSTNAALDAAGTFGTFGKSAGLSGKDLAKFSTDFVGLSTDLASFNNTTPEQAVEAIGAALRGESEPMRQYGVLLDDATLRQRAMKLGLIKTTKEALTPQQKVLAAQAEIYAQTKDAQGDFAKTSGGLANQQRILKAQFEDVKTQVGQFLLPIMSKLATLFTEKVMPAIRDFIQGWKDGSGAGGMFRDTLERVWNGLKTVGGFLVDHKGVVAGLIGAYAGFKVVSATMRGFRAVMLAVKAAQAGYAAATYGAAAATYAQGKAGKIGLVIGKAQIVVTKGIAIAQRVLNAVMRANPIGLIITAVTALVGVLVWFFTKTKLGKKIIATAWSGIKSAIKGVADWWTKTAWPAIKKVIAWFGEAFKTAKKVIATAWGGIKSAAKSVWVWIRDHVITPFRLALLVLRLAFKVAREKITGAWNLIKAGIKSGWVWIRDNVFARIKTALENMRSRFNTAKTVVTGAWTAIKNGLKSGWAWIRDNVFAKLKTGIGAIKTAFGELRDGVKRIWNKIKGYVKAPAKFIVDTVYNKGVLPLVNGVYDFITPGRKTILKPVPMKGWDTGGYTGPGGKYKPAGIVHADEFVVRKESRKRFERNNPGALDHLNRTGNLPGF